MSSDVSVPKSRIWCACAARPCKCSNGSSIKPFCGTTHVRVVPDNRRPEDRRDFVLLMFRCIQLLKRRVAGAKTSLLRLARQRHQRGRGTCMLQDVLAWNQLYVCHVDHGGSFALFHAGFALSIIRFNDVQRTADAHQQNCLLNRTSWQIIRSQNITETLDG